MNVTNFLYKSVFEEANPRTNLIPSVWGTNWGLCCCDFITLDLAGHLHHGSWSFLSALWEAFPKGRWSALNTSFTLSLVRCFLSRCLVLSH